ncbi:MFS transporter [Bacillus bingmayongensis]|uniref:MFS transporter n=1 Tax=Bacillus bingmayongensis TaxID=1150157 RepID=UPI000307B6DC|nr:MFS transporter [Bacillus bingmayongensis]MBY0595117.1 MFS transporter [Bacillus bingmayongensis]
MKLNINTINKEILTLAFLNFLYCLAIYVSMPILALYFNVNLKIPISQVGFLIGLPPIITALFGSIGALVSNRLGEIKCLILGLFLLIIPYSLFIFADKYWQLLLLSILSGFGGVCWKPVIRSLFAHHANKIKSQDIVFRINYIVICLGAILGPLICIWIVDFPKYTNLIMSIALFLFSILLILFTRNSLNVDDFNLEVKKKLKLSSLKSVDSKLIIYIIAGALIYFVFSQFEAVFSLAFKEFSTTPEKLFAFLLILNSVGGIILQFIVMYLEKKFLKLNHTVSILIGNLIFVVAFCLFAVSNGNIVILVIATLIFAMGEVFAIPGSDIIINSISPSDKKTLYFSIAEFRAIGFSLGPIFASFVLEYYGSTLMFISSVFFIIVASILYILPATPFYQHTTNKQITKEL